MFMRPSIQLISEKKSGIFSYLLGLTAFFVLLEISFFLQSSHIYLGDFLFISHRISIPLKIIPGILYFISIQLLLHVLFTIYIWGLARLIGRGFYLNWRVTGKLGFGLWFIGIITILLANQYYFPNSKFSTLLSHFLPHFLATTFYFIFLSILGFATILALLIFILQNPFKNGFIFIVIALLSCSSFIIGFIHPKLIIDAATPQKPNIILIGIDSLRPDFLGFFGYEKQTPSIDHFLDQSTVFSSAFTPLARTFPAWVSILTGKFPKQNGVRFNLPILDGFDWQHTLPAILRQDGYTTIFATDEVRFSNIDERFGFDKVLTPPIGVNDFLLGDLSDFPFMNLLVNTRVGQFLFPYSFANRPAFVTYDPNSFLNLVKNKIPLNRTKPLFLAVHFCLPHYPYFWGAQAADDKSINNYRLSVKRVDRQFNDFLTLLSQTKLLNHSIVFLLSDHGEAIELAGDRATDPELFIPGKKNNKKIIPRFYPPSLDSEQVNQSAGHGTDVLGLTQYHIVLAARLYGLNKNYQGVVTNNVSLLNIKPTLLNFLKLPFDGNSLLQLIDSFHTNVSTHAVSHFFMESDFSPQAVRTVHPETHQLLFEGIEYFQIDPKTARVNVKKSMADLIISSKQYADLYGKWILALYPQNATEMMPILVNLETGEWTNDLKIPFAQKSPALSMLKALQDFYGKEITTLTAVTPKSLS